MRAQFPAEQAQGQFKRQVDAFREWVGGPVEPGHYHLYVSWACPWAHRTIITRQLMGLADVVGMTAVDPVRDERGWAFPHCGDPINGFCFLSEAYRCTDPDYGGRVTVPVLWDTQTRRIVSNSDDDVMRMFATTFGGHGPDLYPEAHRAEIDSRNAWLYERINDGVYRAGFATTQEAYEEAAWRLFEALDELERHLAARRYLIADHPVESDWRLFVTLIRFDAVYHGHFKCNVRRIVDYPALWGYLRDLYQVPGIADTVKFDEIKRHYYYTHDEINPTRIVPIGPALDLCGPHGRERLAPILG